MDQPTITVLPDPAAVAREAAEQVVRAADEAIDERGRFTIALAGGGTPATTYRLLAEEPYRPRIDWSNVHVFFGDERCVPPDHPDSNYRMAREALLTKVRIPRENVRRMRGEIEPNEAAKEYGLMLKEEFGDAGMDLVLLGMGDDGHTASLFPHTEALKEKNHRCAANFVPKLNAWRLTLTAPFINRARRVMVLVTGQNKARRVSEVIEGPERPEETPIQLIRPAGGQTTWLLDSAARGI